jgi:hypothetical protein
MRPQLDCASYCCQHRSYRYVPSRDVPVAGAVEAEALTGNVDAFDARAFALRGT